MSRNDPSAVLYTLQMLNEHGDTLLESVTHEQQAQQQANTMMLNEISEFRTQLVQNYKQLEMILLQQCEVDVVEQLPAALVRILADCDLKRQQDINNTWQLVLEKTGQCQKLELVHGSLLNKLLQKTQQTLDALQLNDLETKPACDPKEETK